METKQIGCKHQDKWCFTFKLKEETIDFCEDCCKLLFIQLLKQAKDIKEINELFKEKLGDDWKKCLKK